MLVYKMTVTYHVITTYPFTKKETVDKFIQSWNSSTPFDDWDPIPDTENVVFIAGPSKLDRLKLSIDLMTHNTNICILDPMDIKANELDEEYMRMLERYYIMHPQVKTVFILPKDLSPSITFQEMQMVVEKGKACVVLLETDLPSHQLKMIPDYMLCSSKHYSTKEELLDNICEV